MIKIKFGETTISSIINLIASIITIVELIWVFLIIRISPPSENIFMSLRIETKIFFLIIFQTFICVAMYNFARYILNSPIRGLNKGLQFLTVITFGLFISSANYRLFWNISFEGINRWTGILYIGYLFVIFLILLDSMDKAGLNFKPIKKY